MRHIATDHHLYTLKEMKQIACDNVLYYRDESESIKSRKLNFHAEHWAYQPQEKSDL